MARFENAFVTGASSGIGRAIALRLAERGTRVVLAARREQELCTLRDEISANGGRAEVCVLDVADPTAALEAISHWDRELSGLDLVLANAGVGGTGPAEKLSWDKVERMLAVNVTGALATLVPAIKPMVARSRGTLAAVTSLAGMRGLPASATYSASKAAVSVFLESLRLDLAKHSIAVVDIRPGFVDTPLTQKNKFQMPFMMDVASAAKRSVEGLERGEAVVTFPWQISAAMTLAESLPDRVWQAVASRLPFRG
ncbi:MAG: SDR family NAD(P)-dependent oxidoreductase [Myxococcales bacterium]|nr:SDR family NAD(P)-dependent oxidoreductase [Myxococcales bacterium]MCB9575891.1 SDR family NAD(P)-dependent oxidoreductase [Polyangiaceae bacterium]